MNGNSPLKKILYMEDEPIIQTYTNFLKKACQQTFLGEVEIVQARCVYDMEKLLEEQKFDGLLLDLTTDDSHQHSTISRIKYWKEHYNLPVIVLTGDAHINCRNACMKSGADDFVLKIDIPFPNVAKCIMERLYNLAIKYHDET